MGLAIGVERSLLRLQRIEAEKAAEVEREIQRDDHSDDDHDQQFAKRHGGCPVQRPSTGRRPAGQFTWILLPVRRKAARDQLVERNSPRTYSNVFLWEENPDGQVGQTFRNIKLQLWRLAPRVVKIVMVRPSKITLKTVPATRIASPSLMPPLHPGTPRLSGLNSSGRSCRSKPRTTRNSKHRPA
jgi:hypothetical protein